jgi:hypothetical protein
MMNESKLGDLYMEKAAQYPDGSMEAMMYMDICGACDLFNGDISEVISHFETYFLPRWRAIANSPNRSETSRAYWASKVSFLEQALEELKKLQEPAKAVGDILTRGG